MMGRGKALARGLFLGCGRPWHLKSKVFPIFQGGTQRRVGVLGWGQDYHEMLFASV